MPRTMASSVPSTTMSVLSARVVRVPVSRKPETALGHELVRVFSTCTWSNSAVPFGIIRIDEILVGAVAQNPAIQDNGRIRVRKIIEIAVQILVADLEPGPQRNIQLLVIVDSPRIDRIPELFRDIALLIDAQLVKGRIGGGHLDGLAPDDVVLDVFVGIILTKGEIGAYVIGIIAVLVDISQIQDIAHGIGHELFLLQGQIGKLRCRLRAPKDPRLPSPVHRSDNPRRR